MAEWSGGDRQPPKHLSTGTKLFESLRLTTVSNMTDKINTNSVRKKKLIRNKIVTATPTIKYQQIIKNNKQ